MQCRTRREGKGKDINKIYRDTDPVEAKDKKKLISHTNSWAVKKEKKEKKQTAELGLYGYRCKSKGSCTGGAGGSVQTGEGVCRE